MLSTAYAQGNSGSSAVATPSWISFVPIILMVLIFYFLIIRPQQKKEKTRKEMIGNLKSGDKVLTTSGIYATVSEIKDENSLILKLNSSTKVEFARNAIQAKI